MADRLVLDASAHVDGLIAAPAASQIARRIRDSQVHAPAHFDAEVLSSLGRLHRAGVLSDRDVATRLRQTAAAPVRRHAIAPLLPGAWRLRHNLQLAGALYAELSKQLGNATIVTADHGLAAATRHSELITAD